MGKSQFKTAADLVIDHCIQEGYRFPRESEYYWAYIKFFEAIDSNFDIDKFDNYILKRI
jgi:hypothetical protein